MLETVIKNLTVAVEANTVALTSGAAPATTDAKGEPQATAPTPIVDPLAITLPDVSEAAPAEQVAAPAADLKQITEGIIRLCKAKGREAAAVLMAEYGAQKVPDLKKVSDKYDEILAKINALIEAK